MASVFDTLFGFSAAFLILLALGCFLIYRVEDWWVSRKKD